MSCMSKSPDIAEPSPTPGGSAIIARSSVVEEMQIEREMNTATDDCMTKKETTVV